MFGAVTGLADPDRRFALGHVPARSRDAVAALWAFDEQLGQIVASTTQPLIGQMRLTWWREALNSAISGHPPLEAMTSLSGFGIEPDALAKLIDGWEELLEPLPLSEAQLVAFAQARGTQLFTLTAAVLGENCPESAGEGWALADFACRCSDATTKNRAFVLAAESFAIVSAKAVPRPLRILVRLAQGDVAGAARIVRTPWKLLRSVA